MTCKMEKPNQIRQWLFEKLVMVFGLEKAERIWRMFEWRKNMNLGNGRRYAYLRAIVLTCLRPLDI